MFAKLGSDMRKPDATTVIPADGWKDIVWPLVVSDLLYAGPATTKLLRRYGIRTIGDLARADPYSIKSRLGKCGVILQAYAQGLDRSAVSPAGSVPVVKSIGNSTTMPRDMEDGDGLRIILYILCESVAERLRAQGLRCSTVQVSLRDTDLAWCERQTRLSAPTCTSQNIYDAAYRLYLENVDGPLRSIGVRASQLDHWGHIQTLLLEDAARTQRMEKLDHTVDDIRRRYGHDSIRRGIMLTDPSLAALNPQTDHPAMPAGVIR